MVPDASFHPFQRCCTVGQLLGSWARETGSVPAPACAPPHRDAVGPVGPTVNPVAVNHQTKPSQRCRSLSTSVQVQLVPAKMAHFSTLLRTFSSGLTTATATSTHIKNHHATIPKPPPLNERGKQDKRAIHFPHP